MTDPRERPSHEGVESTGAKAPRYDLGVLFVHGIGDQQQGATLLQFGDPVIDTLRRWYMGQTRQGVDVMRAVESVLLPARNFSTDPAHSIVEFNVEGECRRWLLAEDWWGDQVVVPNAREFMTWILTRGSWVVLLHLVEPLIDNGKPGRFTRFTWGVLTSRRAPCRLRTWLRKARVHRPRQVKGMRTLFGRLWVLMPWTVLALLLQVPLLVGYILTLVPIPSLSRWVTAAVRRFTTVLGDSFVLAKLESQRGAILTHLSKSLAYMHRHCAAVAVVAHSQGTAVACEVLRTHRTLRPRLLVTFGAGIAKLDQLYLAEADRRLSLTLAGFAPVTAAAGVCLGLIGVWLDAAPYLALSALAGVSWLLVTGRVLWDIVGSRGDLHHHYLQSSAAVPLAPGPAGRTGIRLADQWVDVRASRDPVPTTSLQKTFERYLGLVHDGFNDDGLPIQNRRSFFFDHTTYFGNFAEFVLPLCRLLAVYGDTPLPMPGRTINEALLAHHRRMVALLPWSFWITLLAVPLAAVLFWPVFEQWGTAVWVSLEGHWKPDWAKTAVSWIRSAGTVLAIPVMPAQWRGALAVTLGMVATLLYRPVFGEIWEWWNLQSMESSVQRGLVFSGWRSLGPLLWLTFLAFIPTLVLALMLWRATHA